MFHILLNRPEFKSWKVVSLAHIGFVLLNFRSSRLHVTAILPTSKLIISCDCLVPHLSRASSAAFRLPAGSMSTLLYSHYRGLLHPHSIMNGDTERGCVISMMERAWLSMQEIFGPVRPW